MFYIQVATHNFNFLYFYTTLNLTAPLHNFLLNQIISRGSKVRSARPYTPSLPHIENICHWTSIEELGWWAGGVRGG